MEALCDGGSAPIGSTILCCLSCWSLVGLTCLLGVPTAPGHPSPTLAPPSSQSSPELDLN